MSLALIGVLGWLGATSLVGVFVWGLARAAATGDRQDLDRVIGESKRLRDRREGPADRREAPRPWASASSGRRADDALVREVAEAQQALREAQSKLARSEVREAGRAS